MLENDERKALLTFLRSIPVPPCKPSALQVSHVPTIPHTAPLRTAELATDPLQNILPAEEKVLSHEVKHKVSLFKIPSVVRISAAAIQIENKSFPYRVTTIRLTDIIDIAHKEDKTTIKYQSKEKTKREIIYSKMLSRYI
ncbi:hypothetical protein NEMIN01_1962 [Nematocida minor]|uniref:uncharacterized protein n=1 Tax=Nematocida minor TaxID=1912983 RepID=UPI002220BDEA|nr:uncharacterized protein NEMIN01_1962 [Nematocida minor]KAI5192348.1 hypothetical protein NEMIN01_1962 [Nematocida minor]